MDERSGLRGWVKRVRGGGEDSEHMPSPLLTQHGRLREGNDGGRVDWGWVERGVSGRVNWEGEDGGGGGLGGGIDSVHCQIIFQQGVLHLDEHSISLLLKPLAPDLSFVFHPANHAAAPRPHVY